MAREEKGVAAEEKAAIAEEIADIDRQLAELEDEKNDFCHLSHFCHFAPLVKNQSEKLCEFPVDSLPDEIRGYVEAVTESYQVPVDMVASFVITILSMCIQGKFCIQTKEDWVDSVNLYTIVVARPSERKSPVLKEVEAPVFKYIEEENERRRADISNYELHKKILTGRVKTIQDELSRKGDKSKYTFNDAIEAQKELEALEEVHLLRLILDDVTPEALVSALRENNEHIAIVSAEGGIFGMMAGRYSNNTNIDIFLKGYSGEYYSAARIGRKAEDLKHPLLTILLAVQPQVIADVMENKDFRGKGLLARFLYSIPNTRVGSRRYRTKPISVFLKEDYEKLVFDMLSIIDGFTVRKIQLSPEADALSEVYNQWIEKQLNNELETIEDWAGKLHGNTMRIAAAFHVIKHMLNSVNVPLSVETLRDAIKVGKYYLEHSKNAFDIMGLSDPQDVKDAKYIISRLERNDLNDKNDFITKRDALRLCQRFKSADEMEPGLQCLVEHGYIAIEKEKKEKGRPSEKIYINPEYYKWKEEQKT